MQAKQELDYIILVLNDHLNSLPQSSRLAVAERVQHCISQIEQALGNNTPDEPAAE
ncbi:hypothetical protein AAY80_076 [Stenotrophomonas phage vB_SmaS-DLP_6]|nr:hypothetical protein AAY80_076 [Stenotrophomonas phage vB_SmaS-DLP_6]